MKNLLILLLLVATFAGCQDLVDSGLQLSKPTDDLVIEAEEVVEAPEDVLSTPIKPPARPSPTAPVALAPTVFVEEIEAGMKPEEDFMEELGNTADPDAVDLVDSAEVNPINNNGDTDIIVTLDADAIDDAIGDPQLRRIEAVKTNADETLKQVNADYVMATALRDDIGAYLADANTIYDIGVDRLRKVTGKSTQKIEGYLQEARIIYTGLVAEMTDVKASLHKIMQEADTDIDFAEVQLANARTTVAGFDAEINLIAAQTTLATAAIEAIENHMSTMTIDFATSLGIANQEMVSVGKVVAALMNKKQRLLQTINALTLEQRTTAVDKIAKVMTAMDSFDAVYIVADDAYGLLRTTSYQLQDTSINSVAFARLYKRCEELEDTMNAAVLDSYSIHRSIARIIGEIEAIAN